jgi:hypothetical protein
VISAAQAQQSTWVALRRRKVKIAKAGFPPFEGPGRIYTSTSFTLSSSGSPHGWGGGMNFTYYLPWKSSGFRFQGAGVDLTAEILTVTGSNGFRSS